MEPQTAAARPLSWMGSYRFLEDTEFDPASGELHRSGTIIRVEPQPAAILALLAGRAGQVVTHDEIRRAVWGDERHVNFQQSVHYGVRQVRIALGDRAQDSRFIDTIPRRGYRFRADAVLPVDNGTAAISALAHRPERALSAVTPCNRTWRRVVALACLAAALAAATAVLERPPNRHHEIAVGVLNRVHDVVY